MTTPRTTWLTCALAGGILAAALPAVAESERDSRESYSYVRTLDGPVTVSTPGAGPGEAAEANQPLLVGDQLRLARGARAEILLADRNVLRLDGDSTLTFERVAYSGDREDRTTALTLAEGELLLVVTEDALGDELPEIRTPGATIYVHEPGAYRVEAGSDGWTDLLVRDGYAELLTERGSTVVRAGELARFQGDAGGRVHLVEAGPEDALESWGRDLHEQARVATSAADYVEPELAYAAAPLADYGSWIEVDASWYWRPRVEAGWRPYWRGRWSPTPSGLTWVSSEPWGWVPYHYGTWVISPGYGWVWRPGRVYSPAWVYWSWGDRWAGWCPVGYYTSYYRPWFHDGFRFGVYGWAGGDWGFYSDWNFAPTWCVRNRDWRRHQRTGHDLAREARGEAPRGVITTDTRLITRDRLQRPEQIPIALAEHRRREAGGDAPDVTDFVARHKVLPPKVIQAIGERNDPGRLTGTPLAPDRPKGALASRGPSAPQPWRHGIDESPVGGPATRGIEDKGSPRAVRPGSARDGRPAIEDGAPVRALPAKPQSDGEPRALPRSTPRASGPANGGDPRQGWKVGRDPGVAPSKQSGGTPTPAPRAGSRYENPPRPGGTPAVKDREEPVRRVVGGVRRSPAPAGDPKSPPSEPTSPPRSRSVDTPNRSYQPPSAPRSYEPRSRSEETPKATPRNWDAGGSRSSAPSYTPRTSPPTSSPAPRMVPAPRAPRVDSAPSAAPRAPRGGSTPSVAPRGGSGSSPSAAPRSAPSTSGSSRQHASPPARTSPPKESKPSSDPPPRHGARG